jgi:hypothetical protein
VFGFGKLKPHFKTHPPPAKMPPESVAAEDLNLSRFIAGIRRVALLPPKKDSAH